MLGSNTCYLRVSECFKSIQILSACYSAWDGERNDKKKPLLSVFKTFYNCWHVLDRLGKAIKSPIALIAGF